ncbi:MAG: AAA domain-containing protein [Planctomycetaceae bacterium]
MNEETTEKHDSEVQLAASVFVPARFPVEFVLPEAERKLLDDAAVAVRQEFRDCSKWKRLRCRKVSIFAERDRGTVYVVDVGGSVEFDWTWEGAKAFRPRSLDDNGKFSDAAYEEAEYEDEILWSGEILEVDERNGCLFIALDNPEAKPTAGSFFVRPFEFLEGLDAVYNGISFASIRDNLPQRLAAAEGGIHPAIDRPLEPGLPQLSEWWQHSWTVLWGPPGTGKTYTSGQQIAAVLADHGERILVVSTTNRATDAIALAIGNAAKESAPQELDDGSVLRIGKGASPQAFASDGLETMLRGSESDVLQQIDGLAQQLQTFDGWEEKPTRKRIGELRAGSNDQGRQLFIAPEVRVIVSTAFKAMSFLDDPIVKQLIENGEAPFTTILIDEAGLMSRAAIAALSLLAARRIVLVGDSKQLAPISRMSRILPTRQQTWLGSSGLSHLDDLEATPQAVHVLTEQRRMHPEVCRVVSDFQYGGHLKTAKETQQRVSSLSPFIADFSRAVWYVLDAEHSELAAIRAERGPGNKSWVRSITASIIEKLFSDTSVRNAHGLFISPYKAQAQVISNLFARWELANWEASTVHSQQGSEADIVIFDTVNAGSYNWPFDECKRLVIVAISRAREAVIVLASRSEMEEPYLRPLLRRLTPARLIQDESGCHWEKIDGACSPGRANARSEVLSENSAQYGTSAKTSGGIGEQFATRKVMKPVLSQEQQRLTNLKLDGKARLVRGVAGSGSRSSSAIGWRGR